MELLPRLRRCQHPPPPWLQTRPRKGKSLLGVRPKEAKASLRHHWANAKPLRNRCLPALHSHHVQAPRRPKARPCRLPRLRLLMTQRHRGGKGAITAYLAPKPASSVTEATHSTADASGSSSSLSDARLDALIAQVRALSEQLTKQVALNAELQRQIVDLSLQLRTAKPKRTRSHSPTAPAVHDDADMSSDAEDKQKVPPHQRASSSGRQTRSNE